MSESGYIHGTAPEEQVRLSLLNDILNAACLREIALRGGERVLDVGSGLGQLSRGLARAAGPGGRVVALERSPEQLAEARRQAREAGEEALVEWRSGDALDLPLRPEEWGSFDVAHARFVLEHIPRPEAVVAAMVRAVRPGGRVILADDDHDLLHLQPEPPGLRPVWECFVRSYDRLGNDPFVGRRLPALLHAAGATPRRITMVFFGACAGEPSFPGLVRNLVGVLAGARAAIAATGLVDGEVVDGALRAVEAFAARPDAALWYAMPWAEGVKR